MAIRQNNLDQNSMVLVTGGNGFLGRVLVEQLRAQGKQVRVVGRRPAAPWEETPGIEHLPGDITKGGVLESALAGVKDVYHLATALVGDWETHKAVAVDAFSRMLELFAEQGGGRVVFVSSIMVYDVGSMKNGQMVSESHRHAANPEKMGHYAHSKTEAERVANGYLNHPTVKMTIVRPGIIYGPGMGNPLNGVATPVKGKLWAILGSGKKQLPLIHVKDCADALVKTMDSEATIGRSYNLADPSSPTQNQYMALYKTLKGDRRRVVHPPALAVTTMLNTADLIFKIMKRKRPSLGIRASRSIKQTHYNCDRLKTDAGFEPTVKFEEGLRQTLMIGVAKSGGSTYRFGIIGCGQIVQTVHLPAWRTVGGAKLQAICDASAPPLAAVGDMFPDARQYSDVDDFLNNSDDLDFVVLATPGNSHVGIGEKVLRRKLHLICEKPLALNKKDAVHLYDVAEEEGVNLTAVQNYNFRDSVRQAMAYMNSGAVGDPVSITVRSRSGPLEEDPAEWRKDEIQRVLLFDYGIHFVHMAIMFAGPVCSLQFVDAEVNESGLRYVAFGTKHENGCHSLFELMLDSTSSKAEIEVVGESSAFALDFFPHGMRVLPRRDTPLHRGKGDLRRLIGYAKGLAGERIRRRLADRAIPHARLFSAFVDSLGGGPNPVPKEEILQTISLLDEVAARAYAPAPVQ